MAKNKGIWSYIIRRAGSEKWQFQKRYPVELESRFGKFDRVSLKTSDDALAELKARECLANYEARVKAALAGHSIYDLTKKNALAEMTGAEREVIEEFFERWRTDGFVITRPNWNPSKTDLLMYYAEAKAGKHDDSLILALRGNGILLNPNSEIFQHYRDGLNELHRQLVAENIKFKEVEKATSLNTADLTKFEKQFLETVDSKVARPTLAILDFLEEYAAKHFGKSGKPTAEETRFRTIVKWFASYTNNAPVNHVKTRDVDDFFIRLARFPVKLTTRQLSMSFVDITDEQHGQKTLSVTTAGEWFIRLNRFFSYAVLRYKDGFTISNPMDGMNKAKTISGTKKVKKRAFTPDEIKAIYTQPEFQAFDKNSGWCWLMVALVHHGNRLSEFANRKVDEVKQSADGIWYIDVPEAKNDHSERQVPIAQYLIDLGFLKFVEQMRASGETYLFPDEADGDPDSKAFARRFGRWQRSRNLWKPETTLHNLRSTWITMSERAEIRDAVAKKITGHAVGDVHNDKYKNIYLDTMKAALDKVKIEGFPYDKIRAPG